MKQQKNTVSHSVAAKLVYKKLQKEKAVGTMRETDIQLQLAKCSKHLQRREIKVARFS